MTAGSTTGSTPTGPRCPISTSSPRRSSDSLNELPPRHGGVRMTEEPDLTRRGLVLGGGGVPRGGLDDRRTQRPGEHEASTPGITTASSAPRPARSAGPPSRQGSPSRSCAARSCRGVVETARSRASTGTTERHRRRPATDTEGRAGSVELLRRHRGRLGALPPTAVIAALLCPRARPARRGRRHGPPRDPVRLGTAPRAAGDRRRL